jgi:hypothetical protein
MKMSDLTPEQRAEVIRIVKEQYPDVELRDDAEVDWFVIPFRKYREATGEPDEEGDDAK